MCNRRVPVWEDTGEVPILRVSVSAPSGRHGGDLICPCSKGKGEKQNLVRSNRRRPWQKRTQKDTRVTLLCHYHPSLVCFFSSIHRTHHIPS